MEENSIGCRRFSSSILQCKLRIGNSLLNKWRNSADRTRVAQTSSVKNRTAGARRQVDDEKNGGAQKMGTSMKEENTTAAWRMNNNVGEMHGGELVCKALRECSGRSSASRVKRGSFSRSTKNLVPDDCNSSTKLSKCTRIGLLRVFPSIPQFVEIMTTRSESNSKRDRKTNSFEI